MSAELVARVTSRSPTQDILAKSVKGGLEEPQKQAPNAIPKRFISEIMGGWSIKPASALSRYVVDRFKGDTTWLGPSWITDGTAILKVINSSRENMVLWSVDYDHTTDRLTWVCGSESATFHGVSDAASPVQCRMNEADRKIMLIARLDVGFGSYVLMRGSNLSVAG